MGDTVNSFVLSELKDLGVVPKDAVVEFTEDRKVMYLIQDKTYQSFMEEWLLGFGNELDPDHTIEELVVALLADSLPWLQQKYWPKYRLENDSVRGNREPAIRSAILTTGNEREQTRRTRLHPTASFQ